MEHGKVALLMLATLVGVASGITRVHAGETCAGVQKRCADAPALAPVVAAVQAACPVEAFRKTRTGKRKGQATVLAAKKRPIRRGAFKACLQQAIAARIPDVGRPCRQRLRSAIAKSDTSCLPDGPPVTGTTTTTLPQGSPEIELSRDLVEVPDREEPSGEEWEEPIPDPDGVVALCKIQPLSQNEARNLSDVTALNVTGTEIWPGGLLQGSGFESGMFAPITIPRAPCTITLSNVRLVAGAPYSATVDECSFATVHQATQDLLGAGVVGTGAEASLDMVTVRDFDHFMFKIGLDSRFFVGSVKARMQLERERRKHSILMTFRQKFFDVTVQDPEASTSFFRDGSAFSDPENQIDAHNPPLYVSQVSYGRIVYLVASSDYSARDLEASLKASFGGFGMGHTIRVGVTVEDVLSRTELHYYVLGGDAGSALDPIDSATTPAAMAAAVRGLLGNPELGRWAPSNPGAPISYSLNYLKNRQPARMSFMTSYEAQDCDFIDKQRAQLANRVLQPLYPSKIKGNNQLGEPWIDVRVDLRISDDRSAVEGRAYMKAVQWSNGAPTADETTFEGFSPWVVLYRADAGRRLRDQHFQPFEHSYWDRDATRDEFTFDLENQFVDGLSIYGSTKDNDLGDTVLAHVGFGAVSIAYE